MSNQLCSARLVTEQNRQARGLAGFMRQLHSPIALTAKIRARLASAPPALRLVTSFMKYPG